MEVIVGGWQVVCLAVGVDLAFSCLGTTFLFLILIGWNWKKVDSLIDMSNSWKPSPAVHCCGADHWAVFVCFSPHYFNSVSEPNSKTRLLARMHGRGWLDPVLNRKSNGIPDAPVMSIFFSLLHSRIPTVSFPDVGTYRREKHMSPKYWSSSLLDWTSFHSLIVCARSVWQRGSFTWQHNKQEAKVEN